MGFSVFLGLSRSACSLGIRQECLTIQDFADSAREYQARKVWNTAAPVLPAVCPLPEGEKGCVLSLYGPSTRGRGLGRSERGKNTRPSRTVAAKMVAA